MKVTPMPDRRPGRAGPTTVPNDRIGNVVRKYEQLSAAGQHTVEAAIDIMVEFEQVLPDQRASMWEILRRFYEMPWDDQARFLDAAAAYSAMVPMLITLKDREHMP